MLEHTVIDHRMAREFEACFNIAGTEGVTLQQVLTSLFMAGFNDTDLEDARGIVREFL